MTRTLNQPSANLQELLAQVSTVSGALSTMVTDSVTAVENIRQLDGADELESAFQDSQTCQELRASDGPSAAEGTPSVRDRRGAGQSSHWTPASSWRAITIRCTWLVPS